MLNQVRTLFAQKPYLLAILMTITLVAWMASGSGSSDSLDSEAAVEQEKLIPKVEVTVFNPEAITRDMQIYGRTEPDRVLAVSSEVEGKISKLVAKEGQLVNKGQVIAHINLDDKKEQVTYAKALVKQRNTEYKGAVILFEKGLQDESKTIQAKAALESAKAAQKRAEVMLAKSYIKAPFAGVLNNRQVEIGSYVRKGDVLFDLVDLDPLVVKANVTEKYIDQISTDNQVLVTLANGMQVPGSISYISSFSQQGTNTFPIEIDIDNPDQQMKAGVSSEVNVMFQPEAAIKVSPALLSLDKDGNIGVKTVVADRVVFTPIDLIKAEKDGVWLGGFNGRTLVITLGQGFVRPGDQVDAIIKQ